MTEQLQVRLTQLREAAEQMRRSGLQIDYSVQEIHNILNMLLIAGYQETASGEFTALYATYAPAMTNWAGDILRFADRLSSAADDVELATLDRESSGRSPAAAFRIRLPRRGQHTNDSLDEIRAALFPETPRPGPSRMEGYVSNANRPLFDRLTAQKHNLTKDQQYLDSLMSRRQAAQEDLIALRNRLLSFDRNTDLAQVPRVQTLENTLSQLDKEIAQVSGQISATEAEISELSKRLEQVQPTAGADLKQILMLEHGATAPVVKANTFDCVNYIANRMPIPAALAHNAYLWDDRAAALQQFGISSGDKPLVGAVIVMEKEHSYADPVFGHLMYVERVENGEVWITDNLHPETPVKLSDLTTELSGPHIRYLYFPWQTRA